MTNPDSLLQTATAKNKLIEIGWLTLRAACIAPDATPLQLEEMRNAFFAGAMHLFSSIMTILEPGDDITTNDMANMDAIGQELKQFLETFERRHNLPPRKPA